MTIQQTIENLDKTQRECGWSLLAQRVPKSDDAPYKIAALTSPIKSDEPIVLVLPGSGGDIVTCNGLLKRVHDFIKNNDKTKDARVCVAIYDYKELYIDNLIRAALIISKRFPALWFLMKNITHHPWTKSDSQLAPQKAIYDIYDNAIAPKLSDNNGKRFSTQQLLKNVRSITIVGYCAGGHVAMILEEIIKDKMAKLGYTEKEIKMALSQIPVVGYAMNSPYEKSDLRFFGFNTIADDQMFDRTFKRYLYFTNNEREFDLMHFSENNSDTFYCQELQNIKKINGHPVFVVKKIEDFLKEREEAAKIELHEDHIENKTDSFSEHSFIGFVEKNGFSTGGKQLQSIFKSIVEKCVENSVQNTKSDSFIPLPQTIDLIGDNVSEYGKADNVYSKEHIIYQANRLATHILKANETFWAIQSGRLRHLYRHNEDEY